MKYSRTARLWRVLLVMALLTFGLAPTSLSWLTSLVFLLMLFTCGVYVWLLTGSGR